MPPSNRAKLSPRQSALLALLLLVPAPSVGTALAMSVEATQGTWFGQGAYTLCKLWLVALPAVWLLWVDGGRVSWSPPRRGGLLPGVGLGAILSMGVCAAYATLGARLIDPTHVAERALSVGIGTPAAYLVFAGYLILVNSLLEEYVWRWFVFRKCEAALPPGRGGAAVVLSALFFTLHHVIALRAQFDLLPTVLASLGVFVGGVIWSWCYLKYQSIWPGYLSHVVVDLTLLWIGWRLTFGG